MASQADRTPEDRGGRTSQKIRTRQALLAATRSLLADGVQPTIARAAERALISEATAYRYYSDVRSLLQDALATDGPRFEKVIAELRTLPTLEARARRAASAMARAVLANEAAIRALIAASYAPPRIEKKAGKNPLRPNFRVQLIDVVLEPVAGQWSADQQNRLRLALSVVIAAEAVLSLRDSMQASDKAIADTLGWVAFQIARNGADAVDAAGPSAG